jgi:hypothetical protein
MDTFVKLKNKVKAELLKTTWVIGAEFKEGKEKRSISYYDFYKLFVSTQH